ncbi:unnamed protein product [Orchesella dallaii]|uniref:Gustatory receptor n=1 Tax=Orchesella dallaii TaxID=48710 RepID=A0ABP1S335_9HEXA
MADVPTQFFRGLGASEKSPKSTSFSSWHELLKNPNESDHYCQEFATYEREVANNLGYFAISKTRFIKTNSQEYLITSTSPLALLIYWAFYCNTFIKAIFLAFLVADYFGPVVFLDKIAALDYILCVGIVLCGLSVWYLRYPLHEILSAVWKIENSIMKNLGCVKELKSKVERHHRATVWIHLGIVWIGCTCLGIQFYADPKYCAFTYSAFEMDTWWLKIIFCAHEFFFMMTPWNVNVATTSLCTIEGVSLANLINGMTESLNSLYKNEPENLQRLSGKMYLNPKKISPGTEYNIERLIFDYKQLILISDRFNEWVAYKVLAVHGCSYCQFISDVFVAIQVLKLPGTGFMDVWFYLEDCLAGVYMIYRAYSCMSLVSTASKKFLRALQEYLLFNNPHRRLHVVMAVCQHVSGTAVQFPILEFLDKIGVTLYLLMYGVVALSFTIWFSRYPLFEILAQNWMIGNSVFKSLGHPSKLKQRIDESHQSTVWIHLTISWIGCFCYLVQYYADPKYCSWTYAFIKEENWILFIIFGIHEFMVMFHAWNLMVSSNSLLTFQASFFTNIIEEMTKTVEKICVRKERTKYIRSGNQRVGKVLETKSVSFGTDYSIDNLIRDYKSLMLISNQLNQSLSYKTIFLHACGYCQFIADVFLAVQILRLPGTGVMDIWFFIEDSIASMFMIYRVYKFMSKVNPASQDFLNALDYYISFPNSERIRLRRIIKTLRNVSMKIGPCSVVPATVLSAMDLLSSYYIVVALWK